VDGRAKPGHDEAAFPSKLHADSGFNNIHKNCTDNMYR
jgi:hypothetical protein